MGLEQITDVAPRRRVRRTWSSYTQVLPFVIFYVLLFVLPMSILFAISFWRTNGFELISDFSFANYAELFESTLYVSLLVRTVAVALLITCVVVPMAGLLAYIMRFILDKYAKILLLLIILSLFSGYLVRIYAWRTILGREGLLNTALLWLGLVDEPLEFLIYSKVAVVITLSGLLLPIALLPIYSSMLNVSRDYIDTARDLGAGHLQTIRTVLIPLIQPGLFTALAATLFLAAGDFVTPSLVGGAQSALIGNIIADQFRGIGSNWPLGSALAFASMAVVGFSYICVVQIIKRATRL